MGFLSARHIRLGRFVLALSHAFLSLRALT